MLGSRMVQGLKHDTQFARNTCSVMSVLVAVAKVRSAVVVIPNYFSFPRITCIASVSELEAFRICL